MSNSFLRRERFWLIILCILAGLRIWIFSAAFPFYGINDEPSHFDVIYRYAHNQIPKRLSHMDLDASAVLVVYRSLEVMNSPATWKNARFPAPVWSAPQVTQSPIFVSRILDVAKGVSIESTQPPLYYLVQGIWYRIGRWIGLVGGWHLYWLRFLHVVLVGLLVWLVYIALRSQGPTLRLGAPLLTAFLPQDIFYHLSNDALSPLMGGFALLMLFRLLHSPQSAPLLAALTGFSVAAAWLTKLGNIIFALPLMWIAFSLWRQGLSPRRRDTLLLLGCSLAPLTLWMGWNYVNSGDLTNSVDKIRYLTWTPKHVISLFSHPLWTAQGFYTMWTGTVVTFWRGEGTWHGSVIAPRLNDWFYVASSTLFLLFSITRLFWGLLKRNYRGQLDRFSFDAACFAVCAGGFVFLCALSVSFDFGSCAFPSRQHPFFTAGRLVLGALLPFLVLYLRGFEIATPFLRHRHRLLLLSFCIVVLTYGEIKATIPVFASPFNWFHLRPPADPALNQL